MFTTSRWSPRYSLNQNLRLRRYEREYVLAALAAGKHILLNDPLSTSLDEFVEQQECAKQHQKFFQFVAMFVHQYRTGRFMDRVVREDKFGHIHSISANLQMNYNELEKVGVQVAEKGSRDGCIRVLGRFCVLVSTLMFSRVGSNAVSAKVLRIERGPYKEIISAECIVHFTQVRSDLTLLLPPIYSPTPLTISPMFLFSVCSRGKCTLCVSESHVNI